MKRITKHLMPRYMWFLLWFKQWFLALDGIKGFAVQVMNWLLQKTMAIAEVLNKQNKKMAEAIKAKKAKLAKWYEHATVDADEWDKIKGIVRKLAIWIFIGIATEAACNLFAIESVMEGKGWGWIALRVAVAIGITGLCIYFFEKWFAVLLNKPDYKKTEKKQRNWIELVVLTLLCIGFEVAFYWLCKRRSVALEGASGDDTITYFITIFGMLLPIGAGYLSYERSRYLSALRNTKRIARTVREIAEMEGAIATNIQCKEDHFKREMQDSWALLDEFKIYKCNFNRKKGIKEETVAGHFCETHDTFEKEATKRYNKDVLHLAPEEANLIIANDHLQIQPELLPHNFSNQ